MSDGVDLASQMMLPFLNSLVGILEEGLGQTGGRRIEVLWCRIF